MLFQELGCKVKTREALTEKYSSKWAELEDMTLKKNDRNSKQYRHLVKTKGAMEMEKRKKYLKV